MKYIDLQNHVLNAVDNDDVTGLRKLIKQYESEVFRHIGELAKEGKVDLSDKDKWDTLNAALYH